MTEVSSCFRRRDGVLVQEAKGQTVLLRLDDGSYYAVGDVGARIWELCDGARSVGEVASTLSSEFDAPSDEITADVLDFVADLRSEQLLVEVA